MDIEIGRYAGSGGPAGLDLADFEQAGLRIGIFGSSGAGKGWLLGLILEQCAALHLPIIAIDPESELWTLQEIGALVLGGRHGDAPIPATDASVREVMRFAVESSTPVIFDLGDVGEDTPAAVFGEGERLMRIFNRMTGSLRQRVVFAATEAELFAPQAVPRGGLVPQMLAAIQKRGRKRGVIPILETQRTADIAKSVIAMCNRRYIGHLDEPLDYDNVKRHITGWTFEEMRRLETGHFVATPGADEIVVGSRTVTHGGATPLAGEVQLARRDTSAELAAMLERLRSAPPDEKQPVADVARVESTGGRLLTRDELAQYQELEARLASADRDTQQALRDARAAEARVHEIERTAERNAQTLEMLRAALIPIIGENLVANINMPDGTTMTTNGLSEADVVRLIRQNTTATGTVVEPVEALRTRYLEAGAQRLYSRIAELDADEREALLFLVAHADKFHTVNAIAVALSGSDSGSVRERWGKTLQRLAAGGLVVVGGSGRSGRRENIDAWLKSALGPHDPTVEEMGQVRNRALSLLTSSGSS